MNPIKFTETIFKEKGKKGVLKPDEEGYYTVILGALNTYNSAGEFYTAQNAITLFEKSSVLMRRIKNGVLYSELGHPKKTPSMAAEDFYNRVVTIDQDNICGHIADVTLDFDYGKKNPDVGNPDMIAIIGRVKPSGVKAQALQLSLENPKENSAFSIRGITENKYEGGKVIRVLTNIITWDFVVEPGIKIAAKAYSPAVESSVAVEELSDNFIDRELFKKVMEEQLDTVSMESSKLLYNDIIETLYKKKTEHRLLDW